MATNQIDDILVRLHRLEGANRRVTWLNGILCLGMGALVLLGAALPTERTIEAERFVIKSAAGQVRGVFGITDPSGSPGLVLYDPEANANILLNLGPESEPGLWLYNKDRVRAAVAVRGDRALMELFDKENHRRMVLGVYHDGKPGMELFDERETLRAALGRTVMDLKRTNVAEQHLDKPFSLWDEKGTLVWQAP